MRRSYATLVERRYRKSEKSWILPFWFARLTGNAIVAYQRKLRMASSSKGSSAARTIITAWLVVGVLDISSAITIWIVRGTGVTRGLQGITSALLGQRSYEGGPATAAIGLAIHFFIAFAVVTFFYLLSRKLPALTEYAFVAGIAYGIGVYLVMYWIVLPTVFPTFRHRLGNDALAIAIHICLIGLPTALIVRRYSKTHE